MRLTDTVTPVWSGAGSNSYEGVLNTHQSSRTIATSPNVVAYLEHYFWGETNPTLLPSDMGK